MARAKSLKGPNRLCEKGRSNAKQLIMMCFFGEQPSARTIRSLKVDYLCNSVFAL